jgi:23S rRNA (guanine745-N1)-methyltransferase
LPGDARSGTADTAEMVAARETFLATGQFSRLRELVCTAAERAMRQSAAEQTADVAPAFAPGHGCVVEVGAGTGYYLSAVLDRFPDRVGLALDISKFAARRAARAHERAAAVVCDVWNMLPVADACADLVLDVFAPRNPPEFRRMLRPRAALIVVTPSPGHLRELVSLLGLLTVDERKRERLEQALDEDFMLSERAHLEERLHLSPLEAKMLAAMGPSAHHLRGVEVAARLAQLDGTIETTLDVVVSTYLPRSA